MEVIGGLLVLLGFLSIPIMLIVTLVKVSAIEGQVADILRKLGSADPARKSEEKKETAPEPVVAPPVVAPVPSSNSRQIIDPASALNFAQKSCTAGYAAVLSGPRRIPSTIAAADTAPHTSRIRPTPPPSPQESRFASSSSSPNSSANAVKTDCAQLSPVENSSAAFSDLSLIFSSSFLNFTHFTY